MILILFFLIVISNICGIKLLTEVSDKLHSLCLDLAPKGTWSFAYQAIVCGKNVPSSEFKNALQTLSLIHLLVVSGSHLVFIHLLLKLIFPRFKGQRYFITALLFFYVLITKLQAPAVRALVFLGIKNINKKNKLFWRPTHEVFFAGLVTLLIFPKWIDSLSLELSWVAALAISVQSTSAKQIRYHLILFFMILPVLASIATPHPVSILSNWILGPFIGAILFPLSILSFAVPISVPITNKLWDTLFNISRSITNLITPLDLSLSISPALIWVYIIFLHLFFHYANSRK